MGGLVFGDYRLIRLLTRGTSAEIYLALNEHNPELPHELALKKLLPRGSAPADLRPRLPSQDSPSWQLEHPNIVRVLGKGQVGDTPFVLTEFVDGPDLSKLLSTSLHKQQPLPHDLIHYLAGQVAAALAYAEATTDKAGAGRGVVHRDIFPSVVLLSSSGAVKLDGLELALDPDCPDSPAPPTFGHGAYMSPEQIRGAQLNVASDIFSFGVLLYEVMTGAHPFARENDHQSRLAVLAGRVPSPASLRPSLAPELVTVVERCLCPAPKDRYPTARSLQDAITDAASRAPEVGDSESLADFLRLMFPTQMARRTTRPEDNTVSSAADPIPVAPPRPPKPAPVTPPRPLDTSPAASPRPPETLSAEHMAITTAEFQTTLADPRRVRLVGRPDAAPPTPPTTAPPSRRFEPDDWGADHDPFQLGALLESEEGLLEGSPSEAPTSTSGPVPGDSGPDIYPAPSTGRPSRLWLLPLGASLAVLAMVVALGGPAPELEVDVLVVPNDSASDAPEASEEPKRTGTLTIESSPWAYVSIDGVLREWITPTRLELPSGPHVIGFFHPASDWRTERKVTIRPGEELTLNVTR